MTHPYSKILVLNLSTHFSFHFAFFLSKTVSFHSYIIFNHTFILLLSLKIVYSSEFLVVLETKITSS